jgi:hypothetical protein
MADSTASRSVVTRTGNPSDLLRVVPVAVVEVGQVMQVLQVGP